GEFLDTAQHVGRGSAVHVGRVVRRGGVLAVGILRALLREQLVADALLDVVGLAGEHQEGLVLRLPAEPRDGPVVAVAVGVGAGEGEVWSTENAERRTRAGRGLLV